MAEPPPVLRAIPRVLRAGGESTLRLTLEGTAGRGPYRVRLVPANGRVGSLVHPPATVVGRFERDGEVSVHCPFPSEQEYVLRLEELGAGEPVLAAECSLYAAEEDLFRRRPWKGDFHMHSNRSDGVEEPGVVAAMCRLIGMDYMALTDHRLYAPSLEAIEVFRDRGVDLLILPGEEVHPPENPIHILNVGGGASVNEMLATPRYREEVAALAAELEVELPGLAAEDRYQYASAAWCFREVRASGGLAVYPHPYWFTHSRYDVPTQLTDLLLERMPFDAVELLGGYYFYQTPSNTLMILRWFEERARGRVIPITGSSDAHGCRTGKLFGWYYSITFAPERAWGDLREAHRGDWTVAVEAREGEAHRVWGSFRLSAFAHFLLREVLPLHDEICRPEGELMLRLADGESGGAAELKRRQGSVDRLYRELWAPG